MITEFKMFEWFNDINTIDGIYFHSTNSTWKKPDCSGLGFHVGTLNAAIDRISSFRYNINPTIKKVEINIKNALYLDKDYVFHNVLETVVNKMYKDKILDKEDMLPFSNIYSEDATFDVLKSILTNKYNYDGIEYINNVEDRGSTSYICFYPEQIKILETIPFEEEISDLDSRYKRNKIKEKYSNRI